LQTAEICRTAHNLCEICALAQVFRSADVIKCQTKLGACADRNRKTVSDISRLTKHMPAVAGYRERLATLQGAWDSLALLSHLSEDGTNLSGTRQAFESLAGDLVTHHAAETQKKALLAARARAQVVIDILVRNLFERTADIGFLAADDTIRRFAAGIAAQSAEQDHANAATRSLQRHLSEYVAKYSIYHNVILISPDGKILAQLENGTAPPVTHDPLVAGTLRSDRPYIETYRRSDLIPGARRALIYSHRVTSEHHTLGVLCLCFRLEDECDGIFAKLRSPTDWTVLSLLDADDEVIATSDPYQLPVGARVAPANSETGEVIRFAGREFLAVTRNAQPYQGYAGPQWRGHVMIPLERAFETDGRAAAVGCTAEVLADLRSSAATFSAALREIPRQADAVQRDLNRSVWNGSVRLSLTASGNSTFAKALLREISHMGRKTQEVFEHSIEELHETVVSAVLHDSQFMASLGSELLARNLYERANDCRWWALDTTLIGRLTNAEGCDDEATTRVLQHINSLYTVYHCIVLLDAERRIVATSRPEYEHLSGTPVDEPWAAQALAIVGTQGYSVSGFQPSALYDNRPTLIFGGAVRGAQGRVIGAVAVVFDTAPQLAAMLQDCLPRDESGQPLAGCSALFLDRDLRVMASNAPVEAETLGLSWIREAGKDGEARVIRVGDSYHAVGVKPDTGYREYPGQGGYGVMLIPIGRVMERAAARGEVPQRAASRQSGKHEVREFATFAAGEGWYALPTANVIEAVDVRALQTLPTAEHWCAGYLMFAGDPITVADLTKVLGERAHEAPRIVVIVRVPGRAKPFGLLVELLGDVSEVPTDRLLPVDGSSGQLATLAIEPADPNAALVMILSPERLATLLYGNAPVAESAAA
jgi:chemotaxis signal transduction protein